ncbi:DUF397 domain-containing protein [Nonomuraea rubra]|uniref:DUF397 domain-containing protein n=1 Tax=Nonomuraea rubra TaxID=46180 RepID=UPI001617E0F4
MYNADSFNWRRSSRCETGACVEIAIVPGNRVAIRNSQKPSDMVVISGTEYQRWIDSLK